MIRRILLTLAEDTTETECGACSCRTEYEDRDPGGHRYTAFFCYAFDDAQAARMVEIDPEDAQYTAGMLRLLASDEERRVKIALSAHGRKAVPHG